VGLALPAYLKGTRTLVFRRTQTEKGTSTLAIAKRRFEGTSTRVPTERRFYCNSFEEKTKNHKKKS